MSLAAQFFRFCAVGGVGFMVDAGLTMVLTQGGGWAPLPSRMLAFVCAATVTHAMHRRFTFRSDLPGSNLLPYIALTGIGALINLGLYAAWIALRGGGPGNIFLGVVMGSAVALAFNFAISKWVVFRSDQ